MHHKYDDRCPLKQPDYGYFYYYPKIYYGDCGYYNGDGSGCYYAPHNHGHYCRKHKSKKSTTGMDYDTFWKDYSGGYTNRCSSDSVGSKSKSTHKCSQALSSRQKKRSSRVDDIVEAFYKGYVTGYDFCSAVHGGSHDWYYSYGAGDVHPSSCKHSKCKDKHKLDDLTTGQRPWHFLGACSGEQGAGF